MPLAASDLSTEGSSEEKKQGRCRFPQLSFVHSAGHRSSTGGLKAYEYDDDLAEDFRALPREHEDRRGRGFFDLVKMFGSRILRLAKYITQSDSDAEDVLVETFLKVCPDGSGPRAGEAMRVRLVAIAATEALAKLRHPGHAQGEDDRCEDVVIREISTWGDNYLDRHSPEQTAGILEQAMWSLDPMCRAVFVLRDIEEIPVEQTARILNRSVAAVEVCHLRARLQLREQLAQRFRPPLAVLEDTLLGG